MSNGSLERALALVGIGDPQGVQLLRELASKGNPQALFALGDLMWTGRMVEQDPVRGRRLFEYAASLGHTQANLIVTNLLGSGIAGKRDWAVSLQRLEAEARKLPSRIRTLDVIRAMPLNGNGDPSSTPMPESLGNGQEAYLVAHAVSAAECAYLIDVAQDRFEPSMVYDSDRQLIRDTIRTSDGAALHWLIEDPAIHAINRRIAALTGTDYEQGEPLQALRYLPGQEYRPHLDFVAGASNQRIWTALIYLNGDYEGGETAFVETGLEVRGQTGDVLVFRNAREDGTLEPNSRHWGKPVTVGTKYLATRWIRERRWIV